MSNFLGTAPIGAKSNSPSAFAFVQQSGFQIEPKFEGLDNPKFGSRSIDNFIESDPSDSESDTNPKNELTADSNDARVGEKPGSNLSSDRASAISGERNIDGELVPDPSDATSIVLALDESSGDPVPNSFIGSFWPYLLVATALVGWVLVQLCKKPAPSFKHNVIPVRDPSEIDADDDWAI